MIHKLFVRERTVLGQPIREPTLLALALTALGILLLLAACYVAAYLVASFGFGWFAFVAVAVLLAGKQAAPPTYQFYGLRMRSLDGVLVGPRWGVSRHVVVDVKPDGVFPSDHFGVLVDLTLS